MKKETRRLKCEECGGKIIHKKVDFSIYGISLGKFPAEVCSKCGETLFDEETAEKIDVIIKKRGLWGLAKRTKITKTGNSLAVRIPKEIVNYLKLKVGEEAYIHPEDHKIVIEAKP